MSSDHRTPPPPKDQDLREISIFLQNLLQHAGFKVQVQVLWKEEGFVDIELSGQDAHQILYRYKDWPHTALVRALRNLVLAVLGRERRFPLRIHGLDYLDKRHLAFSRMSRDVERLLSHNPQKVAHIYGLSSVDRKSVHHIFNKERKLRTQSQGFDLERHITVHH